MQYTLSNIPDELERALRERAAAEQKSLDAAILDAIARGLGIEPQRTVKRRDLSGIAGQHLIGPEIESAFEEQRRIDPDLWK